MATTVLHVVGMSCTHCVNAVSGAVRALTGVTGVQVDLAAGTATVEHGAQVTFEALKAAIEEQGYDVVG